MRLPPLLAGLAIAASLLSGCANNAHSRIDSVERRLILPEGAASYSMADHQAFVYPEPGDNPSPAFPPDYPARELPPTTLCASFVVDAEGRTREVKPLAQAGCMEPGRFADLRDAMLAAVSAWRFAPAMFCDYPDAATRNRDWTGHGCAGQQVERKVVPVSLAYAFTFEIRDGKQKVEAATR